MPQISNMSFYFLPLVLLGDAYSCVVTKIARNEILKVERNVEYITLFGLIL